MPAKPFSEDERMWQESDKCPLDTRRFLVRTPDRRLRLRRLESPDFEHTKGLTICR